MRESGCWQRAYLYLARDVAVGSPPYSADELRLMEFEPDAVTRLVGLRPTRAWPRGGAHPRFSSWKYEQEPRRTYDTEEVVVPLLDAIEPYRAGIADACRELGMRAGVMVVIEMDGGASTAAIVYSAETLRRLVGLGLSIEHDQYI